LVIVALCVAVAAHPRRALPDRASPMKFDNADHLFDFELLMAVLKCQIVQHE
jgi:hypothetical protein